MFKLQLKNGEDEVVVFVNENNDNYFSFFMVITHFFQSDPNLVKDNDMWDQ